MGRVHSTKVTLRGLALDEIALGFVREWGDALGSRAHSNCFVGLQSVRRLGEEPVVEVTVSVVVDGTSVWALAESCDWSSAVQSAFLGLAAHFES